MAITTEENMAVRQRKSSSQSRWLEDRCSRSLLLSQFLICLSRYLRLERDGKRIQAAWLRFTDARCQLSKRHSQKCLDFKHLSSSFGVASWSAFHGGISSWRFSLCNSMWFPLDASKPEAEFWVKRKPARILLQFCKARIPYVPLPNSIRIKLFRAY